MSKLGKSIPNMSASIDSPFSRDTTSSRRQTCPKTIVAVARESFKCTEEASIFFFFDVVLLTVGNAFGVPLDAVVIVSSEKPSSPS